MKFKISICMPVYNCAEYVEEALDSILPQTGNQVEVIVFDGGSTDKTQTLIEKYISAWPHLQYHRNEQRGGIDNDLARCVDFAQGEYCWLFSGDDVMRPGAIDRAIEWIQKGYDIYICKHTVCNKKMIIYYENPVLIPDQVFSAELKNFSLRRKWFKRAATTEAFFSFISGIIVKRDKWNNGKLEEDFNGSCWGHVARLFNIIDSGLFICYVPEIWLDQRGENDSFSEKGVVNRYRIAIDGFHKIADNIFGHDSMEAFHIRRVVRNEYGLREFLSAKVLCKESPLNESESLLDELFSKTYSDRSVMSVLKYFSYFLLPLWIFKFARQVYRFIVI